MQVENAIEALRFVSRYSGTIDLVLSDVSMPDMNGPALCRQLQAARPDLRVLLMTGYMNDEMRRAVDPSRLLTKPFSQSELAQRVRAALDPQRAD
jgi:two-component system cell cycle sensor histidine kinase/response regulator CckA